MTTYLTRAQLEKINDALPDDLGFDHIVALCNAAIQSYIDSLAEGLPEPVAYILPRNLKILNFKGMSVPVDALPYATTKEDSTVELETTVPLHTRDQLLQCIAKEQDKWHAEHKCECNTEDACRFARERDEALKELAKAKGEK